MFEGEEKPKQWQSSEDEPRKARYEAMDRRWDLVIQQITPIYLLISFFVKILILSVFYNQQNHPPRTYLYQDGLRYALSVLVLMVGLHRLYYPNKKQKTTWAEFCRPRAYLIGALLYIIGSFICYYFPPGDLIEASAIQGFVIYAAIADMFLFVLYFIHNAFLFRKKVLPEITRDLHDYTISRKIIVIVLVIFLVVSILIAPIIPKLL